MNRQEKSFINKHLEECQDCRNEYQILKAELSDSTGQNDGIKMQEIDYLKKIHIYQKINLFLGAIVSFLFGACIPALKVGIPVFLNGAIPEYYLARLQFAWHVGLLKMAVSGIFVCAIYLIAMFMIRRKLNGRFSRASGR